MRVMNIFVYEDHTEQTIKIRVDEIDYSSSNSEEQENIREFAKSKYNPKSPFYTSQQIIEANQIHAQLPMRSPEDSQEFMGTKLKTYSTLQASSTTYTLSRKPAFVMEWLLSLSVYLNKSIFENIYFQQPVVENFSTVLIPTSTMDDYLKSATNWKRSALLKLHEELLQFKDNSSYKTVMDSLIISYELYKEGREKEKPLTFPECFEINQCAILYDDLPGLLLQSDVKSSVKLQKLFKTVRSLIHTDQTKQLNEMLSNINRLAIRNLFEPCIGKPAYDQAAGGYDWSYTEYELLQHAIFCIRPDGLISISNLMENAGYKKTYAPGKWNHDILKDEMIFLGKVLGLEFEPNCDFHQEMIFTKESSQKLIAQGLHFNITYVKNLLQLQNNYTFFARHIPHLPHDISKVIAHEVSIPIDTAEENAAIQLLEANMTEEYRSPSLG